MNTISNQGFTRKCFICGKNGHIAHYCPSKTSKHAAATIATSNPSKANMFHACLVVARTPPTLTVAE